jgi:MFS family permease
MTAAVEVPVLASGMLLAGVMGVLIWVAPWFWVVLAATLLMGIGDSVGEVATRGLVQRRTPDELRSRVSAASDGIINTAFALSFLLGGVTLNALGPKPVYALGGATCVLGALVMLRVIRTPPARVEPAPSAAAEPGALIAARTPLTSPGDPPGPAPG